MGPALERMLSAMPKIQSTERNLDETAKGNIRGSFLEMFATALPAAAQRKGGSDIFSSLRSLARRAWYTMERPSVDQLIACLSLVDWVSCTVVLPSRLLSQRSEPPDNGIDDATCCPDGSGVANGPNVVTV